MRKHVSGLVMRTGSSAFRAIGTSTARWRPVPDFLLIGGKRTGSTSFFYGLGNHPNVLPLFPSARRLPKRSDTKGVHYFDSNFDKPTSWYLGHMPSKWARARAEARLGTPVLAGEGSPYYLFHPSAAARAHSVAPGAKIIVVLRDPVARCHSHWKEQTRNSIETLSFVDALDQESARMFGEEERLRSDPHYRSFAHENQSYAAQSDYATMLPAWLRLYGRDQVLILLSEDFYQDEQAALDTTTDFLGIVRHSSTSAGHVWNAAPGQNMDPKVATDLAQRFAGTRAYVGDLLQRDLPWTRPA